MDLVIAKDWYRSQTYWGAIVMALSSVLGIFGLTLSSQDQQGLIAGGCALGNAIGLIVTLLGRNKAQRPIKGSKAARPSKGARTARRAKAAQAIIGLALAVILLGGLTGCATSEKQTVATGPDGKPIPDKAGNPIILTHKINDAESHNRAQVDLAKAAKPWLSIEAAPVTTTEYTYGPDGKTVVAMKVTQGYAAITIGGAKSFQVWGPGLNFKEYISQWVRFTDQVKYIGYMLTFGWLWGGGAGQGSSTNTYNVAGGAQSPINIQGQQNNAVAIGGAGATGGAEGAGGAGGAASSTVTNSPTTTNSDSGSRTFGVGF